MISNVDLCDLEKQVSKFNDSSVFVEISTENRCHNFTKILKHKIGQSHCLNEEGCQCDDSGLNIYDDTTHLMQCLPITENSVHLTSIPCSSKKARFKYKVQFSSSYKMHFNHSHVHAPKFIWILTLEWHKVQKCDFYIKF